VSSGSESPRRASSDGREPLDAVALAADVVGPPGPWRSLAVVASTGSTNQDLAESARSGAETGTVLVAEEQSDGRGRLGRTWQSPRGAGLTFSCLVRPISQNARWGWLPLLAGMATAEALAAETGLDVRLKWPNALLVGERKLGGLLAERVGTAVVLGVGVNVTTTPDELPVPSATSVVTAGGRPGNRAALLRAVLHRIGARYQAWDAAGGDPSLPAQYVARCSTIGREVRAELGGAGAGRALIGTATGVDAAGCLLIDGPDGVEAVSAADIVHLR
jgi:BirA family transcriptional regulator, biotin operon repressor / biotin---[acetyl-CoA-carboxylase] ligase